MSNYIPLPTHEELANKLHGRCQCAETDGAGDCDWCMVYYGKVDIEELLKSEPETQRST